APPFRGVYPNAPPPRPPPTAAARSQADGAAPVSHLSPKTTWARGGGLARQQRPTLRPLPRPTLGPAVAFGARPDPPPGAPRLPASLPKSPPLTASAPATSR